MLTSEPQVYNGSPVPLVGISLIRNRNSMHEDRSAVTAESTYQGRSATMRTARSVASLFLLAGAGIRLGLFLSPHALWADEVNVAFNILDRSATGLFARLDLEQYAPIGFLLLTKAAVNAFGQTEQAFRLLPFLCGLVFPLLMWRYALRHSSPVGALSVAALAALAPPLIQYSSQLKPYGVDALVALALFALYVPSPRGMDEHPPETSYRMELAKGLIASVLLLFSFPAVFCLAGLLVAHVGWCVWRRQAVLVMAPLIGALPWVATFGAYYLLMLRESSDSGYLQQFWARAFLTPPVSAFALKTDVELLLQPLGPNVGLVSALTALTAACGILHGLHPKRRATLFSLLTVVAAAAAASVLGRWPFDVRLLLFAAPIALILTAWAVDFICERRTTLTAIPVIGSLLFGPIVTTNDLVDSIGQPTGARRVAQLLRPEYQEGDLIYVYYLAAVETQFYRRIGVWPDVPFVQSISLIDHDWKDCEKQLDALDPAARVWVVFNNVRNSGYDERQAILLHLGRRRDELRRLSDDVRVFGPVAR